MDGLDDFSRSFADALFAAVPSLRDHARSENGLLLINLEPGPERQDCEFWISTDGMEVTVGFGLFHMHFDWPVRDAWPESAPIKFVQSVMADETLIVDWTLAGKWSGSSILAAIDKTGLESMQPGHVANMKSWSGNRDRTIRGR
jgi:regulator of extracellular matrix RemA (YlzA/DUF370 family)